MCREFSLVLIFGFFLFSMKFFSNSLFTALVGTEKMVAPSISNVLVRGHYSWKELALF